MRKIICILLATLAALPLFAQKEQDFAERYMALYAEGTSLQCTTVSPSMLERMMQLPSVEEDTATRKVLAQLKSIRMLTHSQEDDAELLFRNAAELASHHTARFKSYAQEEDKQIYVRRKGSYIVEVVLFMVSEGSFCLIDLTGNMTDNFLGQVLRI